MATNWGAGFVVRTVASPAQGSVAIPSSALLVGDGLSPAEGGDQPLLQALSVAALARFLKARRPL